MVRTRTLALIALAATTACGGSAGTDGASPASQPAPVSQPAPAAPAAEAAPASSGALTLASGVYTAEQAERGETSFRAFCAECHSSNEMAGSDFMFAWEGNSVGRLFRYISTMMPDDDPGSLPEDDYRDIMSWILSANDFPAGDTELPGDLEVLNGIMIAR